MSASRYFMGRTSCGRRGAVRRAHCDDERERAGSTRCDSIVERQGPVAGELHQRRRTLQLGVLHELRLVELAVVEADRAHVEAAALLDELRVHPLDGRL